MPLNIFKSCLILLHVSLVIDDGYIETNHSTNVQINKFYIMEGGGGGAYSAPYTREGGRYDHEPININSGAHCTGIVCYFYFEPLGSYSKPLNLVLNPALFSQQLRFLKLILSIYSQLE